MHEHFSPANGIRRIVLFHVPTDEEWIDRKHRMVFRIRGSQDLSIDEEEVSMEVEGGWASKPEESKTENQ